ncbi:MAG: methionyl-tRNA formyltransferase [Acidimicrobiia bacterium]
MIRAAFLGTPAAAVPTLAALMEVAAVDFVVTQPDRPKGRGRAREASSVKVAATEWGLPTYQPHTGSEVFTLFASSRVDVAVVVAYGRILAPEVLASVEHGFVNVHFSLLPRWRGAAPVERAILAGDTYSGISLMVLDAGLDTGPVIGAVETEIGEYETAGELTGRLAALGADVLRDHLEDYIHEKLLPARQMQTGAAVAPRLTTAEARLHWTQGPREITRAVRAFNPRPGAWMEGEGTRLKIFEVGPTSASVPAGEIRVIDGRPMLGVDGGAVEVIDIQQAGKPRLSGRAWANGRRGARMRLDAGG